MTEKNQERLDMIRQYFVDHDALPTYREMALMFNVSSTNSCKKVVDALVKTNHLRRFGRKILTGKNFWL
jgi:SOS-response transcriptional repressor LexA